MEQLHCLLAGGLVLVLMGRAACIVLLFSHILVGGAGVQCYKDYGHSTFSLGADWEGSSRSVTNHRHGLELNPLAKLNNNA